VGGHTDAPDDVDVGRLRVLSPRLRQLREEAAAASPLTAAGASPMASSAAHSNATASIHRPCHDPAPDGHVPRRAPVGAYREPGPGEGSGDGRECATVAERRNDATRRGISGISGITATIEDVVGKRQRGQ